MILEERVCLIIVVDIRTHSGHVAGQRFHTSRIQTEAIGVLHTNAGNVFVIDVVNLMAAFKAEFLFVNQNF